MIPDLTGMTPSKLFVLYRRILAELRDRKIVRTENAPTGDYAEYLVAMALQGRVADSTSEKGWDVELPDGTHLQVKCRVVSDAPKAGQLQLSPFRTFGFDEAVIVLLSDADYSVRRAVRIPREQIEANSVFNEHVHGYIVHARPQLLDLGVDVTKELRAASAR